MLLEPTILLLDVSFRNLGVAVWNLRQQRFVYLFCLSTKPLAKKQHTYVSDDNVRCCQELTHGLRTIIGRFQPKKIFAEMTTSGAQNANAASCMGMSLALVSALAVCCKLPLYAIQPRETKELVHGGSLRRGEKVPKKAVQDFVEKRFGKYPLAQKRISLQEMRGLEHIADAMALIEVVKQRYSNLLQTG
jgi:Holliday junction resolvasome RuvABC endonuclease subunit